jgi:hypothetical protein
MMLDIFSNLFIYLKSMGIVKILYKCIPYIYFGIPSEEDRFALFINKAQLVRRDVTTSISQLHKIPFKKNRRRCIEKGKLKGIIVRKSFDYIGFWSLLNNCLTDHHSTIAVHSLDEIVLLKEKFPENIHLYCSYLNETMLAGVVIYKHHYVAHAQYIAASELGRENGGLDIIFNALINQEYDNIRYFDFGISNEMNGRYLNEGLIFQKEGFGARAVVHDWYEVCLNG